MERRLQKPPNRSVVFLRQHDLDQVPRDFLRWFLYRKPPPLTKLFQFIAIGRNVKQNKVHKMQSVYFFCFLSIQAVSEKETVQSLNGSKPDINNLHTTKFGSTSQVRVFAELSHYNPFIYLLHVIADNCFAHGK